MLRGFYTAASGMLTQQRRQESLANNIANQNTPGFKADQPMIQAFPELLIERTESQKTPTMDNRNFSKRDMIGSLNTGVILQEIIPNHQQGDLRETELMTDVALVHENLPDEASIFFTVLNNDGDLRLTRNGNFTVDGEGYLVTTEGYYVLDDGGNPIHTNGHDFHVTAEGIIQTDTETIPLGLAYIENVQELVKEGNDLFNGEEAVFPETINYTLHQGFLERSNVNTSQTMTEMMRSYRQFELNQRVLKEYDKSLEKTINDIGRIG